MKKVLEALEAGKEIDNAEEWKSRAFAAQSVASIVGGAFAVAGICGYHIDATPEQLAAIGGGLVALVGGLSALFSVLTTKRLGIRRSKCR